MIVFGHLETRYVSQYKKNTINISALIILLIVTWHHDWYRIVHAFEHLQNIIVHLF